MNGCSPYSSKTTEQRLHEKHAELKESEQVRNQGKQKHRNMPKPNKACIRHTMLYNF